MELYGRLQSTCEPLSHTLQCMHDTLSDNHSACFRVTMKGSHSLHAFSILQPPRLIPPCRCLAASTADTLACFILQRSLAAQPATAGLSSTPSTAVPSYSSPIIQQSHHTAVPAAHQHAGSSCVGMIIHPYYVSPSDCELCPPNSSGPRCDPASGPPAGSVALTCAATLPALDVPGVPTSLTFDEVRPHHIPHIR